MKKANELRLVNRDGHFDCADCGGLVWSESTWWGKAVYSNGFRKILHRCEDCDRRTTEWQPEAQEPTMRGNLLTIDSSRDYLQCAHCGGLVESEADWLGEDDRGRGMYDAHYRCEECGRWVSEIQYG